MRAILVARVVIVLAAWLLTDQVVQDAPVAFLVQELPRLLVRHEPDFLVSGPSASVSPPVTSPRKKRVVPVSPL